MAVSKQIVVLFGVLSILCFAGAISVTVIAKSYCGFMINTPAKCGEVSNLVVCCKCADILNSKCISTIQPQALEGFGVSMIIFFWLLFAVLSSTTGILYNKIKRGDDRAHLLHQ